MSIQLHTTVNAGTPLVAGLVCSTQRVPDEQQQRFPKEIFTLVRALQIKDVELYSHSFRTQYLSYRLSLACGLMSSKIRTIALGGLLHDIGKIGIRETILNKREKLTIQEYTIIKEHPVRGTQILSSIDGFETITPIVRHHHERWDGMGYPDGLSGEAIPLGARIVAIADAFEAMLSHRPYQAIRTPLETMEELYKCAGTQFDPTLVHYFCTSLEQELFIQAN
jgi:putative two-component system response regulator